MSSRGRDRKRLLLGRALLAPVGVLGGHDPLDRAHPVVEPAGEVVQFLQQPLVAAGQRRRRLPRVM
jgi:hypothetical protein